MSIKILSYDFTDPYPLDDLPTNSVLVPREESGVYVILGKNIITGEWDVIDVGKSENVCSRVRHHDRVACWKNQSHSSLAVAAYYTDETSRMLIEAAIRLEYRPPCGER